MSTAKKQNAEVISSIELVEQVKRQWLAVIDALIDPLMIIDQDFNIIKTNQALANHANESIAAVLGQKCYNVFAQRNSPCNNCNLKQNINKQEPYQFEIEKILDDQHFEVTAQPVSWDHEKHVVHIYRDRTEAKKLREQLLQQEKLASIGLLAGGIAHEINNPLGGIIVFSQMLLKEMPKNSSFYEDVVEIEGAAQRCKEIVKQLLDFARQDSPQSKSKKEDFSISEILEQALKFIEIGNKSTTIKLESKLPEPSIKIHANKNQLIQVFLNILQNSYQACGKNGQVTIDFEIHKNKINLIFSDNGHGIKKENLTKIFDPFYTTKEPGEGTGLGLSIAYSIIKELGGDISVESKVNKGTTLKITLPVKNE